MNPIIPLLVRHVLLVGVGAGIIVLMALALRLVVRRDAVLRYQIMVTAMLAGVALFPLQLLVAEFSTPTRPGVILRTLEMSEPIVLQRPQDAPLSAIADDAAKPAMPLSQDAPSIAPRRDHGAVVLLAVYLAGVVVVLGWYARELMCARRLLARSRPVSDPRVLQIWSSLVTHLRRPPALLESERLHAPACSVIGRATIIVPSAAVAIDDDTLTASLRHELVHLTRGDGRIVVLAAIAKAFVWFQPLVWIFARVLRTDLEQSCDAIVVRATDRPRAYARALLRFCDPQAFTRPPSPLIGFESAQSVRRRITMLSFASRPTNRLRRTALLVAGFAGLGVTMAAHGHFSAAAGLRSMRPAKPQRIEALELARPQDHSRMSAEVIAPPEDRAEVRAYEQVMDAQRAREQSQRPGGLVQTLEPKDRPLEVLLPVDRPEKVYPRGTWVTLHERIVSIKNAHVDGNAVRGSGARIRLPQGSKLRAAFEGRTVDVASTSDQRERLIVKGGSIRLLDEGGVMRLELVSDRNDAVLSWSPAIDTDTGERVFDVAVDGAGAGLEARTNIRAGVPEGEQQPPHGAVRWELLAPQTGPGAIELRMKWIYDVGAMRNPEGC